MAVVRLLLAYDGTGFRGWATQPGVRTVEGLLGDALERVLGGDRPRLSVAGRTDAGVHAIGQVASFRVSGKPDTDRLQRAVNAMLAPEVVVRHARLTADAFDARRWATGRAYLYRIHLARVPDPMTARYVWHHPDPLALGPMRAAARELLGEHDFASFCRAPLPPASTVRTLRRLSVARAGEEIRIRAEANGFLHQMVRSLVGTLAAVGEGRMAAEEMPEVLTARRRQAAGHVAPPHGLALVRVSYGRRPLTRP